MTDPDINLVELIDRFGTEDKSRDYLEHLRWPDGVRCPRCDSDKISRIRKRHQFDCDSCRYQFSVRAGTIFHDSKLPLWKWFLAIYLMVESKKGISANQIKRTLGVTYKTAWYLCHRIRSAMEDDRELLDNVIEMDETWVGGKIRGKGMGYKGNKSLVIGAVERGGPVRVRVDISPDGAELGQFVRQFIADDAEAVYTDDLRAYKTVPELGDEDTRHETVSHSEEEWVRGDVHTNTVESVWSLLKRSIVGSYHQLSRKHLDAYLDEMAWRFNNRENPYLFRDTLRNLLTAERLTYKELISHE